VYVCDCLCAFPTGSSGSFFGQLRRIGIRAKQLQLKFERRTPRNLAILFLPVSKIRGHHQNPFATHFHPLDALIPPLDHFVRAKGEDDSACVKLRARLHNFARELYFDKFTRPSCGTRTLFGICDLQPVWKSLRDNFVAQALCRLLVFNNPCDTRNAT
jgi:hypothetical protein